MTIINTIMKILTWQARIKYNMTLEALAKVTGISKTTLNDIENGKTIPRLDTLEQIAKALNMRITDLFDSEYK